MSLPVRGRGLKQFVPIVQNLVNMSLPVRGRGLKLAHRGLLLTTGLSSFSRLKER